MRRPYPTTSSASGSVLARPRGPLGRVLYALVRFYQVLRAGRPSPCRFDPTCSTYALEAITKHGSVRGSLLAMKRVGRCHPWGGAGWDPVPEPRSRKGAHSCSI